MSGRLWDKGDVSDEGMLAFCVGDDHRLDSRLVAHDVRGSIAHATMLGECGYLTALEVSDLVKTLNELADEHASGGWEIALEEEDVHTALENRLVARLGELGGKIHLGRSRNDQVMVSLRLYMREEIDQLAAGHEEVAAALESLVDREGMHALPGYTHTQRAMPSTVADWAGAYAAEFRDDARAFRALRPRIDLCPLGSAAGYGTPGIAISRARTAELLGFSGPQEPATAVQLSRGKAESALLFELVTGLLDLGRLATDVVLYASAEFGFVKLPRAFTTGSSIMPQKRNPDVFELLRGHASQAAADLQAALGLRCGLGSGYHRDLQLLKSPLFRGIDRGSAALAIAARAIAALQFDSERCAAAMESGLYATERANRLVAEDGLSFRAAYRQVAREL